MRGIAFGFARLNALHSGTTSRRLRLEGLRRRGDYGRNRRCRGNHKLTVNPRRDACPRALASSRKMPSNAVRPPRLGPIAGPHLDSLVRHHGRGCGLSHFAPRQSASLNPAQKVGRGPILLKNLIGARKASAACGSVRRTSPVAKICPSDRGIYERDKLGSDHRNDGRRNLGLLERQAVR